MRVRWKSKPAMTEERLRGLIAAYGAAADRWPEAERDAAEALRGRGAAAAEAAEARALDRALDGLDDLAPAAVRWEGFGEAALRARAVTSRRLSFRPWKSLGAGTWMGLRPAALAVSVLVGLAYGLTVPPTLVGPTAIIERIPVAAISGDAETMAVDVLGSAE